MLLNPGGMDLYSEILPYNPIQATPLLTFTQPDSFSTIFSSQGEAQVKRKKNKTNQANIFYICCGRWQETGDFRNLTASNTVRWGLLKTNGTQDKTWGTTLSLTYALHATSSIRHAVGTRNNPSQKCAELRTMVACKNQK